MGRPSIETGRFTKLGAALAVAGLASGAYVASSLIRGSEDNCPTTTVMDGDFVTGAPQPIQNSDLDNYQKCNPGINVIKKVDGTVAITGNGKLSEHSAGLPLSAAGSKTSASGENSFRIDYILQK